MTTVFVVSALAIGVGMNTAMFCAARKILWEPYPFREPAQLVMIQTSSPAFAGMPVSYPDYFDWKSRARSFSEMAAIRRTSMNLTGRGFPERLAVYAVSASYFRLLGVSLLKGRDFAESEDRFGAPRRAIISFGFWERSFAKDPSILGKRLLLNGDPYEVIGIAPRSQRVQQIDVWVPIGLFADSFIQDRRHRFSRVIARLAPGVTASQAQTEMQVISDRLGSQYPLADQGFTAKVVRLTELLVSGTRKPLLLLFATAGVVLFLACLNIGTAALADALQRKRELSVRMALGARRFAIIRYSVTHSMILAAIGTVAGLFLAYAALAFVFSDSIDGVPEFDFAVYLFACSAALITSLLASVVPAVLATRGNISEGIKAFRGSSVPPKLGIAGQYILVSFQVFMAMSLGLIAGFLIQTLWNVTGIDTGFKTDQILSFQVSLPESTRRDPQPIATFYGHLVASIKQLPGVVAASTISNLPLTGSYFAIPFDAEGNEPMPGKTRPFADNLVVSPGYFDTLQVTLLSGRDFRDGDGQNTQRVAIVDDVFAKRMWSGQDAIGKHVRLGDTGDINAPWLQVIGVVKQVKQYGPEQKVPRLQVYTPLAQQPTPSMSVVLRFEREPTGIRRAIIGKAYELDKTVPIYNIRRLDDLYSDAISDRKMSAGLLVAFAITSLILCAFGIYAIVANTVAHRHREITIRLALGSTFSRAVTLILRPLLWCWAVGTFLASVVSIVFGKLLTDFLVGVNTADARILGLTAAIILVFVGFASFIPAHKLRLLQLEELLRR